MEDRNVFYREGSGPFVPRAVLGLTRLYGVADDGSVSDNSRPFDLEYFTTDAFGSNVPQTIRTFETGSSALKLGPGAACVLGKPYSGKTLFADTLLKRNPADVVVIRFREPEVDALLYEKNLVQEFYRALKSSAGLIFIDSLRTTFYVSGGATGKGGVNMGIYALLTAFDVLAKHHDKVIMFSLNPMTTDEDAIQFYIEAAKGSVAHTLYATQPKHLTVSSRSSTTRDDFRQKYEPVNGLVRAASTQEIAPSLIRNNEDSIVDLYVTTSR